MCNDVVGNYFKHSIYENYASAEPEVVPTRDHILYQFAQQNSALLSVNVTYWIVVILHCINDNDYDDNDN